LNTSDGQQKVVANEILTEMRKNKKQLVEEATIVSRELMKVAITPHEQWYDGLEQAAQFYMDSKDIKSMVNILVDLHETMNESNWTESKRADGMSESLGKIGSISLRDVSFRHTYGKSLQEAFFWLEQFRASGRTVDLHQAWEIYQSVFKKIKSQLVPLKNLELEHVAPALFNAKNLCLAVPGTYKPSSSDILITSFSTNVSVITSKQRPRRISMFGSNGRKYQFLLKGHEDLRQDERVMQLFGLINACLNYDRLTSERGLNIIRYSVLPLSNNSGLIEWVQSCDTVNQLIRNYREENEIRLLTEMRLLQSKSRSYDKLPLLKKVELFQQVLDETTGGDLSKIMWLKSQTSDIWVERRANFTKSLAVMSMAGYILGLGDRHPSNLMIQRVSGNVVHIDFGDCFEITANRSKYPEIIPFRLTRMLTTCMEPAGVQGAYRLTCERVSSFLA
jgi:FKBP12-rapamycin complex-associated protein